MSAADQAADYARARQLMLEGQYPAASSAFQDYLDRYGDAGANAPEARYWLGQTLFVRKAYGDAAAAYIGALRGWPVKPWAPSAMVKLSMALIEMNKPADACGALDEFGRRYQAAASAETRALAATARVRAKCG